MNSRDGRYPSIDVAALVSSSWTEGRCKQIEQQFQSGQRAWLQAKLADDAIRWPDYPHLYKYRTVNPEKPAWTETIVKDGRLWATSLDRFNDPLEAAFAVAAGLSESESESLGLANMAHGGWVGCVSFSSDPVCVQMWAHYAASHTGICIHYRRADSYLLCSENCQPMSYRSHLPVIVPTEASMLSLFWAKSDAWAYEREWRLMYPRANGNVAAGLLVPSGIIFGLRTPKETKALLREWAPSMRFGQIITFEAPYRLRVRWDDHVG